MTPQTQKPTSSTYGPKDSKPNRKQKFGKGKSKYAQKRNKPAKPVLVKSGPVSDYTSICCRMPAVKPPCGKKVDVMSPDTHKMKATTLGLGTWRCAGCHLVCKVTVSKHREAESTVPTRTEEVVA